MRAVMTTAGAVTVTCGLAMGQAERPALRALETGIGVEPVRAAPAVVERGEVVRVGDWVELGATRGRHDVCRDYRVFDAYGDVDWDGYPDDARGCGLGSSRWHFGSGYCNGFYSNDMTLAPDTILDEGAWRFDVAWYWTGPGSGSEQCVMLIFTQNSNPDECEDDTFDYPAWLIDFGALECNPGAYYFASIDISLIGRWDLPPSGTGSYGTSI